MSGRWISGTDYTPEMVEQAVRTLTPAQRRAVLRGSIGGPHGASQGRGYWPLRNGLMERGLMTSANLVPVLTNFGQAVREALQKDLVTVEPASAGHDTIADSDGDDGA